MDSYWPGISIARRGIYKSEPSSKTKPLPKFRSEAKEREFWESKDNDATEYVDSSKRVMAKFKNLKPSTTSISLRLPDSLLDGIRQQANKKKPTDFEKSVGSSCDHFGRGERIRTSGLYVPNVALYQAKLHPDLCSPAL